ncbi:MULTISPECIES: hypothetical protein [unclassified Streptomyces]|jgi:hypothetical protein|nr:MULTISPECIES: hypothetical protein [unclassified Streptomyces]MYQ82279.1 hypothetical protein [Streptomyces sp. SID4936]SCD32928.1 hypothetical protein GA0115234_100438 [Streptomyces sp. DvalAA-43]
MKFDLIANTYAVIHGEVTGPCADILAALGTQECACPSRTLGCTPSAHT